MCDGSKLDDDVERERCLKIGISHVGETIRNSFFFFNEKMKMKTWQLGIVIWVDFIIFRRNQLIQQKEWVDLSQGNKKW